MKKCNKCRELLPYTEFHKHYKTKDGYNGSCKSCRKKQQQEYRKTSKGKQKDKRYNDSSKRHKALYSYWERYPERKSAQNALSRGRRDGTLCPPDHCENCGSDAKLEGHHWSYDKANWTDIFWLCKSCHEKEHEMIKLYGYSLERKLYVAGKCSELIEL